jgi:uncharacterized protein
MLFSAPPDSTEKLSKMEVLDMLIRFSFSDWPSLEGSHELSMEANNEIALLESNTSPPNPPIVPRLVRAAVIYGPPSAGKTSWIKAMNWMQHRVLHSIKEKNPLPDNPGHFNITLVANGMRYQYGFLKTSERIHAEWLDAYHSGRRQPYFRRQYDRDTQKYIWNFGTNFGRHKPAFLRFLQEGTTEQILFLSLAALMRHELLLPVYQWFSERVSVLTASSLTPDKSLHYLKTSEGRLRIREWMRAAGVPGKPIEHISDLQQRSDSVQRLFALAGCWLDAQEKGHILCVDDLDLHLHALISRFLIRRICHAELNPHNAQLIATVHDVSLLDSTLLRRDQIWFLDQDKEGKTRLYPLSSFRPNRSEDIRRDYLQGRYGALPQIS